MSDVITRIGAYLPSLTPKERRVANLLLMHPERFIHQSVQAIALATDVSVASVSRLARRLGYDHFKQLKIALAQEIGGGGPSVFEAIRPGDSDEQLLEKVFTANIRSIQDTLKLLDRADLIRAAKALVRAERILFFGIGGSGCLAHDTALRFSHLDLSAEAYTDPYQMIVHATRLRKGQLAVGFSHSGRSQATVEAIRTARENQAVTIGVGNYRDTPLQHACDLFFCTSFPESGVSAISLSSRCAQQTLMDALYVLAARHGKLDHRVKRINEQLERQLRLSPV